MGVCNCSMFCCTLLYVHSSIAIILMGKRDLVALLNSSSWCLVMVERLFPAVPRDCLQFVIVVFPDHTHLLFCSSLVANLSHIHLLSTLVVARSDCVSSEWRSLMDCLSWSQLFLYNKIVRGTCFVISGFALTLANTIAWSERPV